MQQMSLLSFSVAQCRQKRNVLLRFSQSRRRSWNSSKHEHLSPDGDEPGE